MWIPITTLRPTNAFYIQSPRLQTALPMTIVEIIELLIPQDHPDVPTEVHIRSTDGPDSREKDALAAGAC